MTSECGPRFFLAVYLGGSPCLIIDWIRWSDTISTRTCPLVKGL
jgi:hypothetical protein